MWCIARVTCLVSINLSNCFASIIFPNEASPMGLQHDMFIPAIMGHGTEEQHRKWGEPALACAIMGTYAQTELGHGERTCTHSYPCYQIKSSLFIHRIFRYD